METKDIYLSGDGDVKITEGSRMTPNEIERKAVRWAGTTSESKETQLDRIEKKLDRLLNILENGEPSSSISVDGMVESLRTTLSEAEQQFSAKLQQIVSRCC